MSQTFFNQFYSGFCRHSIAGVVGAIEEYKGKRLLANGLEEMGVPISGLGENGLPIGGLGEQELLASGPGKEGGGGRMLLVTLLQNPAAPSSDEVLHQLVFEDEHAARLISLKVAPGDRILADLELLTPKAYEARIGSDKMVIPYLESRASNVLVLKRAGDSEPLESYADQRQGVASPAATETAAPKPSSQKRRMSRKPPKVRKREDKTPQAGSTAPGSGKELS